MTAVARKAKDEGNAAFRAENFPEAVGLYTAAIVADNTDPTLPLNRAAAYLKLGKNIDAERDCSTALRLSPGHVKALYRRAQARSELGKLSEAEADLQEALKTEPGNNTVKAEVQRIKILSEREKKKIAPLNVEGMKKHVPSRRRRIPIEIVESVESSSATVPATDALTPISSRTLPPEPEDALPTPLTAPAREPSKSVVFVSSPIISIEPPKANSTPRGGIFRPSGENTLFRATEVSHPFPKPSASSSRIPDVKEGSDAPQSSPLSLFDFSRTWELASPSERWECLCEIPPQALPALFRNSLEATLLVQILEVCSLAVSTTGDPTIKARVRDYLSWFQRVPRFQTVTLFLSKQEKESGRVLADTVGSTEWKV